MVSLLPTAGDFCVAVQRVLHQVTLPIVIAIFWCRTPPPGISVRAKATAFFEESYLSRTFSLPFVKIIEPVITFIISPSIPQPARILQISSTKVLRPESRIHLRSAIP